MRLSNLAVAVVGTVLFLGSAYAAKVCDTGASEQPGVNAQGNLDEALSGELQCTECVNTKNGKVVAKCSGQVTNESGDNQKFKNPPDFPEGFTKVLYKVKKNGAAKLTAKGVVDVDM